MCDLQKAFNRKQHISLTQGISGQDQILAVYTYGIDQKNKWSEGVFNIFPGADFFEYDCTNTKGTLQNLQSKLIKCEHESHYFFDFKFRQFIFCMF